MNSGLVQLGSSQIDQWLPGQSLADIRTDIAANPAITSSLSQSLQGINPSALILKAGLYAGSATLTGQDINQSLSQFAFQVVGDIAQKQLTQALKQHQIASNSGNQDKQLYWQSQVSQWAEGGAYKVALHAIAGGLMAQATGSDFKTGALVAGASQALAGALTEKLAPSETNNLSLTSQQINQQLKNQLHQQLATIVGGVTAQLSGEKSSVGMHIAGTADQFNRQMHYDDFVEKLTACHNQNSSDCQQLQQMAGVRNEFIEEVPELPESSVVINYNEDNEVVSYTVVNKSQGNRPVLIFEPKEFEAYKAGSLSTRGLYLLSPQWSFDIGSAALYADEEKSLGYITDAVTSPEYIFTAITSTMGASAYLGRSNVVTVPKGSGGVNSEAANRALHEAYKMQLRQQMFKPSVNNPQLQKLINGLYRPNAKVGSGSTADAIRYELSTGQAVGGRFHSQKGTDSIRALEKWLGSNPKASLADRAATENIILDMRNALGQ